MAVKYLRSAAAGTASGADWTNAFKTLVLAFAGMSAGDTLYVADDHAETQGSTMTLTSPGTAAAPCLVICVNTHVTMPPTGIAATATITTTGQFAIVFAAGVTYVYGIIFTGSSGAVSSGNYLNFATNNISFGWTLDQCKLRTAGTGGNLTINIGVASGNAGRQYVRWINTTVKLSGAVTTAGIYFSAGRFIWAGGSFDGTGIIPASLFWGVTGASAYAEISGVDLSAVGSGKNLWNTGANLCALLLYIRNCRLGASVTPLAVAIAAPSGELLIEDADSGSTNYRMEHYKFQGSIVQETTKVRASGGASDGTTPLSHKFVTLASGPTLFSPLEGPWCTIWNDAVGSKTVTVELATENVALYNDECWIEIEYLGTSGFPQSVYAATRVSDVFATHALLTTSAVAWNGFSVPAPQKLALAVATQAKGWIRARVCVAKASTTLYVDPLLTLS